jgi:hypothetical protein
MYEFWQIVFVVHHHSRGHIRGSIAHPVALSQPKNSTKDKKIYTTSFFHSGWKANLLFLWGDNNPQREG